MSSQYEPGVADPATLAAPPANGVPTSPSHRAPIIGRRTPLPCPMLLRHALFGRLDAGVRRPCTLLHAPAGFGKTALLTSWLSQAGTISRLPGPLVWLDLGGDEHARSTTGFWTAFHRALIGPTDPGPGASTVADVAAHLADGAAVLVVDEFHRADGAVLAELGELLGRATGLRVVGATRRRLPLASQRSQLQGDVVVIDATDLAFTDEETTTVLRLADVGADEGVAAELHRLTAGWPAAIGLALRGLSRNADPEGVTPELLEPLIQRNLVFYVREEMLTDPADAETEFLLRTSIVDHLEPELAALLSGAEDGRRRLRELTDDGLLIDVDADHGRVGYPELMRAVFRGELSLRMPSEAEHLHLRASGWYTDHGYPLEAMRHARAAGGWTLLVELLSRHWVALLAEHSLELRELALAVPRRHREGTELFAIPGACHLFDGQGTDLLGASVTRMLERFRADWPSGSAPRAGILAATGLIMTERIGARGDYGSAVGSTTSDRVAALPPEHATAAADVVALFHLAHAGTLWQLGRFDEFGETMRHLHHVATEADLGYLRAYASGGVALGEARLGRLFNAERHVADAWSEAGQRGWMSGPVGVPTHLAAAYVALERADPATSAGHLDRLRHIRMTPPGCHLDLARARAGLAELTDDPTSGLEELRLVEDELAGWVPPPFGRALLATCRAELLLARDEPQEALRALDAVAELSLPSSSRLRLAAVRSRVLVRLGAGGAAYAVVEPWIDDGADLPPTLRLAILVAGATAAHGEDEDALALDLFRQGLAIATATGLRRELLRQPVDTFKVLAAHVRTRQATRTERAVLDDLDELWTRLRGDSVESTLSPRERFILAYLANGLTVREMGDQLHVSQNTLKTQLRSIYRKLGVGNRDEAVTYARNLRLV